MTNPFGLFGELTIECLYNMAGASWGRFGPDGSGNATINVPVQWGSVKSIDIIFSLEYDLRPSPLRPLLGGSSGNGNIGFSARWLVSFTDSGVELTQDGVQPRPYGKNKSEGKIVVAASATLAQSERGAQSPFVEMAVTLVTGNEEDGIQVGLSKGPISVGGSVGGSKVGGTLPYFFRLNLETVRPVVPVKVPVVPPKPVAKVPPSLLTPSPLLFDEDQDTLSAQSTRELHEWVSKLKDHEYLGAVIANGTVPLEIQAFASTTGGAKYNKGETDRRLNSVKKILQNAQYFGSSLLRFEEKSHGMEKADGEGPANAFNRRVEIKIDHNKAMTAGEALKAGTKQPTTDQSSKMALAKGPEVIRNFWTIVGGAGAGRPRDANGTSGVRGQ
jgi:outer membrane protein OmpA-like peptidoglycan-associated protein